MQCTPYIHKESVLHNSDTEQTCQQTAPKCVSLHNSFPPGDKPFYTFGAATEKAQLPMLMFILPVVDTRSDDCRKTPS